eukprot:11811_1
MMINIFLMILATTISTRAFVASQGRRQLEQTGPMISGTTNAMLSNQLRRILADSRPSGSDSDGDGDSDSSGDLDQSQSDSGSDSDNDGNSDSSDIEEVSYSMDA